MKDHLYRLVSVYEEIKAYRHNVIDKVEYIKEDNFKKMSLIRSTIQHLDRVLYMETRKRKLQVYELPTKYYKLIQDAFSVYENQLRDKQTAIEQNSQTVGLLMDKMSRDFSALQGQLKQHIDDWAGANSASTIKIKKLIDYHRAERIRQFTEIYNAANREISAYPLQLNACVTECEYAIVNANVLGRNKNKEYEAENVNLQQQFAAKYGNLYKLVVQEVSIRTEKLSQIVQTLGYSIEMIYTSMSKLGRFLKEEGK